MGDVEASTIGDWKTGPEEADDVLLNRAGPTPEGEAESVFSALPLATHIADCDHSFGIEERNCAVAETLDNLAWWSAFTGTLSRRSR